MIRTAKGACAGETSSELAIAEDGRRLRAHIVDSLLQMRRAQRKISRREAPGERVASLILEMIVGVGYLQRAKVRLSLCFPAAGAARSGGPAVGLGTGNRLACY